MYQLLRELRDYDPQLILWRHPVDHAWYILRQPNKYGSVPKDGYSDWEVLSRLRNGTIVQVYRLEHEPGIWVLDWLKARDAWSRRRAKEILFDIDARNERKLQDIQEEPHEVLREAIKEDWRHIRDELRGDSIFRKWVVGV